MADFLLDRLRQAVELDDSASAKSTVMTGPAHVLPSVFDVTGLASGAVTAANEAAAQVLAIRTGEPRRAVHVDRRAAAAAFLSEVLFTPQGWDRVAMWDPIAGDYRAADGWIRLHTNYRHHRLAAEAVLGAASDRARVAEAVRVWPATELETAIVDAGGCAAAMHDRTNWLASPAGVSTASEPVARVDTRPAEQECALPANGSAEQLGPFAGVRVLDLTRVIAGPVCTRFLAAYGADVLRIDPPGFAEVPALVPETSAGKHCATLRLSEPGDRGVFEQLLRGAHVLVCGLRPGALTRLGYDQDRLHVLNPDLVTASLDAYGWSGPWAGRRGFDSLVQMSCGIAAAGAAALGRDRPTPLPAQALDHASGYLLAAAIGRALVRLVDERRATDIQCSLVGTANLLTDYPVPHGLDLPMPKWSAGDTEPAPTAWGPASRVPVPGRICGHAPRLRVDGGPLGRHRAAWSTVG